MNLIPNRALAAFMAEHRLTFDAPSHAAVMRRANEISMAEFRKRVIQKHFAALAALARQ